MDYFIKQSTGKLAFPDLHWSRPENRLHAGKLLVIGGNLHGFAAPAEAYNEADKAGAGAVRVLLPDATQKLIGKFVPEAEYAPSTPSGSFAQQSLNEWLISSSWADHVLLAGDLSRNSETAIVIEKFLDKSPATATLTKDTVDYILQLPNILDRANTTLIVTMAQLQKLFILGRSQLPIAFDMDLLRLAEALHDFTFKHPVSIVVKQHQNILCATNGQVSSTLLKEDLESWRVKMAAHAAVWQMQHPGQVFEALTTAASEI